MFSRLAGSALSIFGWVFYDLCREMSHQIMCFAEARPLLVSLEDVYLFKI